MKKLINAYRAADAWLGANLIANWARLVDQAQRHESHAARPTGRHRTQGVRRSLFSWHSATHRAGNGGYVMGRAPQVVRDLVTDRLRDLAWGALAA